MSAPVLAIAGLRKRFGALAVTDGVDLDVRAGEIHALIGPNGAGKTTLINLIAGTLAPDAGTIRLDGRDITRLAPHRRVTAGLARSFQMPSLVPGWTVGENLALALRMARGAGTGLFRRADREADIAARLGPALARVGLAGREAAPASDLSHGEKRALEIALALALDPHLLLLDEPLAGTGPEEAARLVALIADLRAHHAILLIEHDMSAVFALADRVSVLVEGRIVAQGSPDAVRADPAARAAYLGTDA